MTGGQAGSPLTWKGDFGSRFSCMTRRRDPGIECTSEGETLLLETSWGNGKSIRSRRLLRSQAREDKTGRSAGIERNDRRPLDSEIERRSQG